MAYARFSEDSDVYCYYDGHMYHTCVAVVELNLPCDGQSFKDTSLKGMLERLNTLQAHGYRVPESVFIRIEHELDEEA